MECRRSTYAACADPTLTQPLCPAPTHPPPTQPPPSHPAPAHQPHPPPPPRVLRKPETLNPKRHSAVPLAEPKPCTITPAFPHLGRTSSIDRDAPISRPIEIHRSINQSIDGTIDHFLTRSRVKPLEFALSSCLGRTPRLWAFTLINSSIHVFIDPLLAAGRLNGQKSSLRRRFCCGSAAVLRGEGGGVLRYITLLLIH